jgi:putative pyrroloquinoline-quinone binding quinoprotein
MPVQDSGQHGIYDQPTSRRSPRSADAWPPPRRHYPALAWTVVLLCAVPVIAALVIARIHAENPPPTRPLWALSVPGSSHTGDPANPAWEDAALSDGNVIALATANSVTGYSVSSGRQEWRWTIPGGQSACSVSPTVSGNIAVVEYSGTFKYTFPNSKPFPLCTNLEALNLITGKPAWRSPIHLPAATGTAYSRSTPYLGSGVVVAADLLGNIEAFSLASGARLWSTASTAPELNPADVNNCGLISLDNEASLVTDGDTVYAAGECGGANYVYGVNLSSGKKNAAIRLGGDCGYSSSFSYAELVASGGGYLVLECPADNGNGGSESIALVNLRTSQQTAPLTDSSGGPPEYLASPQALYLVQSQAVDAVDPASGAVSPLYRLPSADTPVSLIGADASGLRLFIEHDQRDTSVPSGGAVLYELETIPLGSGKPVAGTTIVANSSADVATSISQSFPGQRSLVVFIEPVGTQRGSLAAYDTQPPS